MQHQYQKFLAKNPSWDQYDRKSFQNFFYPIPIRESFLGQKLTQDQCNIKKFTGRTNTTPTQPRNGNFWTFWWYYSIFWQYFGHFLPFCDKFWQILVISGHFFVIFWVEFLVNILLYGLDSWNTNITNTNMFSILTNTNIANIDMIWDLMCSGQ